MLKDNLRFEDDTEVVVFNHYSFCELIKHIMVQYGKITYEVASEKIEQTFLYERPSINELSLLEHELEFHWAMLLVHGDMYWTKGIPSDFIGFKEEYLNWELSTRQKYNLKVSFESYER